MFLSLAILYLTSMGNMVLCNSGDLYTRKTGFRLEGVNHVSGSAGIGDKLRCAKVCSEIEVCKSFNFKSSDNLCVFNDKRIYDFGSYYEPDVDWDYYGEDQDDVKDGNWTLAFRAENGNNVKISTVWESSVADVPKHVSPACFSSRRDITCSNHFKSKRMLIWYLDNIHKIRFNFYKNGTKVVEMIFNGLHTDNGNWFDKNRLLQADQWVDIFNTTQATFSLTGQANRRFYITTESNRFNCDTNYGWVAVINAMNNACQMDKKKSPAFLYSPTTTKMLFNSGTEEADVMAVFFSYSGDD